MEPIKVADTMSPEWYAARKNSIGASEISAAAGLCPYQTPLELYYRKRGELPEIEDTDPMRMGRLLEPVVKSEFLRVTGLTFEDPNPPMYRHGSLEFATATPDGVVTKDRLFEAKTASWRMKGEWGDESTDEAPVQYVCQTQWQMAVMNAAEVDLAVLFDGSVFKTFKVLRNDELIQLLIAAAKELWERIKDGKPPEPNWTHASTPKLIKAVHSTINDTRIELNSEEIAAWEKYERIGRMIKKLDAKRDECKARVLYGIGDHFAGLLGDGRMVRRKEMKAQSYMVEKKGYIDVRCAKADDGRIVERA